MLRPLGVLKPMSPSPRTSRSPRPSSSSQTVRSIPHPCPANNTPANHLNSLWLGIQKRPPPRRQLRQSRLLRLHPGCAPRRLSTHLFPPERRASSQRQRTSRPSRHGQEYRHRRHHPPAMAAEAPRGCHQASHRRLRQRRGHDPRYE